MGRLHGQGGGQQSLQRGVRIGAFASDAAPELRTLPRHPAALGQEKVEEASRERPVCFRDRAGVRILRDGSVCRGRALRRGFRPDMPEVGGGAVAGPDGAADGPPRVETRGAGCGGQRILSEPFVGADASQLRFDDAREFVFGRLVADGVVDGAAGGGAEREDDVQ